MYVCVCRAVTEQEVKAAIDGGAESVCAVTRACQAGDDCGACHQTIEDMIEEHAEAHGCSKRRLPVVRAA
jgi:bacterioferritin-associated ferredoxin